MNRTAKNEVVPERGLRDWSDMEHSPFDMIQRGRNGLHRELDACSTMSGRTSTLLEPWTDAALSPCVDETEDDKAYHQGEKKQEKEVKEKDYYRMEHSFGSFRRVLPVLGAVDESKIQASF